MQRPRIAGKQMDILTLAAIIVPLVLLAIYAVIVWEFEHDTKPRDPYHK